MQPERRGRQRKRSSELGYHVATRLRSFGCRINGLTSSFAQPDALGWRLARPSTAFHHFPSHSSLQGAVLFLTRSRRKGTFPNTSPSPQMSTSLGDQGSQVRVQSPRAFVNDGKYVLRSRYGSLRTVVEEPGRPYTAGVSGTRARSSASLIVSLRPSSIARAIWSAYSAARAWSTN